MEEKRFAVEATISTEEMKRIRKKLDLTQKGFVGLLGCSKKTVERVTGLRNFGIYMNQLFTIDALFLNEDRHTHNMAVLMDGEGRFSLCPVFDNGGALLSDMSMDYPMSEDPVVLMREVKAKTISTDFDEQLDVSKKLYGQNLRFHFTKKQVAELLENAVEYEEEIRDRVASILYLQMDKYRYLWK